jgi:hypothetical protein
MFARMRPHLTFANVASALALFVALSTGGAYASHLAVNSSDVVDDSLTGADVKGKAGTMAAPSVNGSLTTHEIAGQPSNPANGSPFVQGSLTTWDIADGAVRPADVQDNSLAAGDLAPSSVNTSEVADNSLTGADIKDQSGVDTCVSTTRVGQLCVRAENFDRTWFDALNHCANLDLRLPTLGEAWLVKTHDIPNIHQGETFWTQDAWENGSTFYAWVMTESGISTPETLAQEFETVCVMTPTN